MDNLDRQILQVLYDDARTPVSEIARRLDVARSTVHERLKRMTSTGLIARSHLLVDRAALGLPVHAYVLVSWSGEGGENIEDTQRTVQSADGVEAVHLVSGTADLLVELSAPDMETMARTVASSIRTAPGVVETTTLVGIRGIEGAAPYRMAEVR